MARLVERWLETFSCGHYASTFENNGFKTLQSVCYIDNEQLCSMGIVSEHTKKIIEKIAVLRQSYGVKIENSSMSLSPKLKNNIKQISKTRHVVKGSNGEHSNDDDISNGQEFTHTPKKDHDEYRRSSPRKSLSNGLDYNCHKENKSDTLNSVNESYLDLNISQDEAKTYETSNCETFRISKFNGSNTDHQHIDELTNISKSKQSLNERRSRRSAPSLDDVCVNPSKKRKIDSEKSSKTKNCDYSSLSIDCDYKDDHNSSKSLLDTNVRSRRSAPPSVKYKDFIISPPKKKVLKEEDPSDKCLNDLLNGHTLDENNYNIIDLTDSVELLPKSSDDSSNTDETIAYLSKSDDCNIDSSIDKINSVIEQLNSKYNCNKNSQSSSTSRGNFSLLTESFQCGSVSDSKKDDLHVTVFSSSDELSRESTLCSEKSDTSKHLCDRISDNDFNVDTSVDMESNSNVSCVSIDVLPDLSTYDSKTVISKCNDKRVHCKAKTNYRKLKNKSSNKFDVSSDQKNSPSIFERINSKYSSVNSKVDKSDKSSKHSASNDIYKVNGPSIRLTGPCEIPDKCQVINRKDQFYENDKHCKKYSSDFKYEKQSKLSNVTIPSKVWDCCFCKRGSHMNGLGDLFGPYYSEFNCSTSNSSKSSPKSNRNKNHNSQLLKTNNENINSDKNTLYEIWCHGPCAVWTHGICLSGGRISGLQEALSMSQNLICSSCNKAFATLECLLKNCNLKYHYICAVEHDCNFNEENFSLLCQKHKKTKSNLKFNTSSQSIDS